MQSPSGLQVCYFKHSEKRYSVDIVQPLSLVQHWDHYSLDSQSPLKGKSLTHFHAVQYSR